MKATGVKSERAAREKQQTRWVAAGHALVEGGWVGVSIASCPRQAAAAQAAKPEGLPGLAGERMPARGWLPPSLAALGWSGV